MKAALKKRPPRVRVAGVLCIRGECFLLVGAPRAEPNPMKQVAKARRDRKATADADQRWREAIARARPLFDEMGNVFGKFGMRL
jgi:hypothetical protein